MSKITFYKIIFLLISLSSFAQFEGFEGTSLPDASGNWALGSGNWRVFDNGIGLSQTWNVVESPNPAVYDGTRSAFLNRENVPNGSFASDWLVTPQITVPPNGQLRFYTRQVTGGNAGSVYTVRVSNSNNLQTNLVASDFTTIQTYSETGNGNPAINTVNGVYEEQIVSLAAFPAGMQIYIAFEMSNNFGDRWLIDNVNIVEKCLDPINLTATNITDTTADLSWTNLSNASQWEIEIIPTATNPFGSGPVITSNPYTVTGLTFGTCYKYYVRNLCTNGFKSDWTGPFYFCTNGAINTCVNPTASFSPVSNCSNIADTFYVKAFITNMGTATSIVGTTSPASTSQIITSNGQVQFGPFTNGTNVQVNLQNQQNVNCFLNSPVITQTICPCANNINAFFDVVSNCSSGTETFFITANVTNMGSATSIEAITFPTSTSQIITSTGQIQFGPFANGTNVRVKLQNQQNAICHRQSQLLTFTGCHSMLFTAFLDLNDDGIKQNDEPKFTNGSFEINKNNSSNPTFNISSTGNFLLHPVLNTDLIDASFIINLPYNNYLNSATIYNDISVSGTSSNNQYFLPITTINPYSDVNINFVGITPPRPGFTYKNRISFKNNGVSTTNGTITFTKNPNVTITSISNSSAVINSTGFTLDYTNLLPQETRYVNVFMSVPNIPIVNLGDVVTNSASITSTANDIDLLNNNNTLNQTVVGSYDPNDKMEAHGETININSFTSDDYLYYTIRFQNTGTANAINVRIEDLLNAQLNPNTLRMIGASHDYTLTREGNQLIWNFVGINLPGIFQSEELSQGFVTFKIKPNSGFAVNDMIPNTAEIYFDFNPAIITNTFQTTFVNPLSNENFSLNNITIYPNPSNDILNINYGTETIEVKSIEIQDMLGKVIYKIHSKVEKIDVSNMNSGIYFITISTESNGKIIKKLIKN